MIAKTVLIMGFFTLFILLYQSICNRYKLRYFYGYKNDFDIALNFMFEDDFISRDFK